MYAVTDPVTGQRLAEYATASPHDIEQILQRSAAASGMLRGTSLASRTAMLSRISELHVEQREHLAMIATREMGKPITQARAEVDIVVTIYRWYADNAARYLVDEELEVVTGGRAIVRAQPIGPLLGIMPWNFPYYQVARLVAPNLAVGNTIVLKHAPQCPESALAQEAIIRQALREAGLPQNAYQNVFADNDQIADIIADDRIQGVSLTGSARAGSAVAAQAGAHLKRVVLELGGSDPFILLDTNDMDDVVQRAVFGRLVNGGQACNASKRFLIADDQYDLFVERFVAAMGAIHPGPPNDDDTFLGPLSSSAAVNTLDQQVRRASEQGAVVRIGGHRVGENGAYYAPTVLTDVTPEMDVFSQELFGPVAMLFRVHDDDEVVALANGTPFGLGASVHTDDPDRALALAERLEAGMVYINEPGGTSAELPFGGVKQSGFGRELGKYGLTTFTNQQLVRIAP